MKEYIIDKTNEQQRFDKYIKRILPSASNAFIYKMLRKKNIELNSKRAKGDEILKAGDSVRFFFSDETFEKMKSSASPVKDNEYVDAYKSLKGIEIVYENEDFMIVNKPKGILCQKDTPSSMSLNEWAIGYFMKKGIVSRDSLSEFKPSVLNRLDRNTTGLVLVGKSLTGSRRISEMLNKRTLHKYYIAKTKGNCNLNGLYEAYLYKNDKENKVYIYDEPKDSEGKKCSLIKNNIKVLKSDNTESVLEIELITGKSHQIRAHLSYLGYPLKGDVKYGGDNNNNSYQDLTAYKIVFPKFDENDDWFYLNCKVFKLFDIK